MKRNFYLVLLLCPLFLILSCSQGDIGPTGAAGKNISILEFQQGNYPSNTYAGVTDAYIEGGLYAVINYGNSDALFVGRYIGMLMNNGAERFLLKFDLSELQNQYIAVQKAEIVLYANTSMPTSTTMTVTPYEVTKHWEEMQVTWNNNSTTTWWATAGGDYLATPAGNSLYLDKIPEYKIFNIKPSVVQKWIDNPQNNFGLIFISDTESIEENRWIGFYSKDHAGVNYRPKLTIYYTLK